MEDCWYLFPLKRYWRLKLSGWESVAVGETQCTLPVCVSPSSTISSISPSNSHISAAVRDIENPATDEILEILNSTTYLQIFKSTFQNIISANNDQLVMYDNPSLFLNNQQCLMYQIDFDIKMDYRDCSEFSWNCKFPRP